MSDDSTLDRNDNRCGKDKRHGAHWHGKKWCDGKVKVDRK